MPGGTERVINTKSTTVVENIIEELCSVIGIEAANEREEFSLYCIVEGETFTVPLAKEHYILDVTTELQRDGAIYYLIFCRSVWWVNYILSWAFRLLERESKFTQPCDFTYMIL